MQEALIQTFPRARDRFRAEAFVAVFEPIFERYQKSLVRLNQIDFHDMINRATEHVESGRYHSPFRYVLVDEFQDISCGRARLLKALLDQSRSAQLFAVGDDWQSIYRFAGSDIAIMREFEDRFGTASGFTWKRPSAQTSVAQTRARAERPCHQCQTLIATRIILLNEWYSSTQSPAAQEDYSFRRILRRGQRPCLDLLSLAMCATLAKAP